MVLDFGPMPAEEAVGKRAFCRNQVWWAGDRRTGRRPASESQARRSRRYNARCCSSTRSNCSAFQRGDVLPTASCISSHSVKGSKRNRSVEASASTSRLASQRVWAAKTAKGSFCEQAARSSLKVISSCPGRGDLNSQTPAPKAMARPVRPKAHAVGGVRLSSGSAASLGAIVRTTTAAVAPMPAPRRVRGVRRNENDRRDRFNVRNMRRRPSRCYWTKVQCSEEVTATGPTPAYRPSSRWHG